MRKQSVCQKERGGRNRTKPACAAADASADPSPALSSAVAGGKQSRPGVGTRRANATRGAGRRLCAHCACAQLPGARGAAAFPPPPLQAARSMPGSRRDLCPRGQPPINAACIFLGLLSILCAPEPKSPGVGNGLRPPRRQPRREPPCVPEDPESAHGGRGPSDPWG